MSVIVHSERLNLRLWRNEDRPLFAKMNADSEVMRHFPSTLSRKQSDASIERFVECFARHGYCFFAAELKKDNKFIGFVGLNNAKKELPIPSVPEIGWRLKSNVWGQGLATEGALAAIEFAFAQLKLPALISMTPKPNKASERVMQKIGMTKTDNNFMHTDLPEDHDLAEHVLYSISREKWLLKA